MQSVTYYFTFWKNVILFQLHITYYFIELFTLFYDGFQIYFFYPLKLVVDVADWHLLSQKCTLPHSYVGLQVY